MFLCVFEQILCMFQLLSQADDISKAREDAAKPKSDQEREAWFNAMVLAMDSVTPSENNEQGHVIQMTTFLMKGYSIKPRYQMVTRWRFMTRPNIYTIFLLTYNKLARKVIIHTLSLQLFHLLSP